MTSHHPVHRTVIGCKLKQNANEGCNSCASLAGLVLSFVLLVIAPLVVIWPCYDKMHWLGFFGMQ